MKKKCPARKSPGICRCLKEKDIEARSVAHPLARRTADDDLVMVGDVMASVRRMKSVREMLAAVLGKHDMAFVTEDRRGWYVVMKFPFFCEVFSIYKELKRIGRSLKTKDGAEVLDSRVLEEISGMLAKLCGNRDEMWRRNILDALDDKEMTRH